MRDIRIYIQGIGLVSQQEAVTYVATGLVPEEALLAGWPEEALARYRGFSPERREDARRNLGAVHVADFDENGQPRFASSVELYPPDRQTWGTRPAHISAGGTSRSIEESEAYAQALTLAVSIAREAETLTAVTPAAGKEQSQ